MCVEKKYAKEYLSGLEALSYLYPGNAFACNRMKIFDHYGIFIGWIEGVPYAIHFSGKVLSETCIRFEKFLDITGESKVRVFGCSDKKNQLHIFNKIPCDPIKVVTRAMKRLCEGDYNIATWNCESYVNWVFYHIGISSQSVKAAPSAMLVAMVNPVRTAVAGNLAKTFLDSSIRTNSSKFKKKQEDLKKKIENIIERNGIGGLMETQNNMVVQKQLNELKGTKFLMDKVQNICHLKN